MTAYDTIRRAVEERAPALWAKLTPRRYAGAPEYRPEDPAVSLGALCAAAGDGIAGGTAPLNLFLAAGLIRHQVPTWFVGRELLAALDRTAPPADLRWPDVRFPFPAGVLLFPRGAVTDSAGKGYGWVAFARVEPGEPHRLPGMPRPVAAPNRLLLVATASADDPAYAGLNECLDADSHPVLADPGELPHVEGRMSAPEAGVVKRLAAVALNAVLLMQARPELVEAGAVTARGRTKKKGGVIPDTWSPSWLGRTYAPPGRPGDGTHASPRLHWRRGHWRMQRHGSGSAEVAVIWIEPTIVGGSRPQHPR